MPSSRLRLAAAVALAFASLIGDVAYAERPSAAALAREAAAAEASGDLEGAASLYGEATRQSPEPDLFEKLARVFAALGQTQNEARAWRDFLDAAPEGDPRRPEAEARLATLEGWVAATSLELSGLPDGARLYVDARPHGDVTNGTPIPLPPGRHALLVRADGYEDFRTTMVSPVGGTVRIEVTMAALPVPPRPVLPVALWATGGTVLATGATLGSIAFHRSGHQTIGTAAGERSRRMAIGADVLMVTGAAAALAGGAIYYFFYRASGAPEGSARLELMPYAGPTTFGLDASWAL
jgi:hypothetical protein